MKKIITLLLLNLVITTFVCLVPKNYVNAATGDQEIDIATTPEKLLFDVTNLAPGDWAERTLTIQNKGKQDFKYLSSVNLKEGSEKFYNELLLQISDQKGILFNGKMKDFNKLEPRFIAKNGSEQLFLKIVVPEELGNDFQGLGSEVEFKFYVEGTLGGLLPVDGPKLPDTGTNSFNILLSGAILLVIGTFLQFILKWRRRSTKHV
ncbi:LPXTG cell wall anchor domain-containing protein [Neobacillus sp. CF12]|uniref:LPXTG cell wall anchor domain-containing protein n=1 Tax=Neobacillus sp. CF12 TaxID=3055864 RepID=UPI0025A29F8F|nr:LPXTG cell wall anchor domain-containing protein [Neobacillus sp. CF12]MDM5331344.1 LPXTG cell wall anchor domain-containing protein [Neobacillus sp. CF12]